MSASFYLQFMALRNGRVEKCKPTELCPDISPEKITQISTLVLAHYGVQHNPYILDFMTVLNKLNPRKRFILESGLCTLLFCLVAGIVFTLGASSIISVGIGFAAAVFFSVLCPLSRRFAAQAVYLFYKIIICGYDRRFKDNDHVMFSAAGKIVVRLNEYLLKYSTDECLIFVDELSINDFIYQLTGFLKRNVSEFEKIRLCFTPGHRLRKYFLTEKDFVETFAA